LIGLLQQNPKTFRLDGPTRLKFIKDLPERPARLEYINQLLEGLNQHRLTAQR
jgi:transcription-repair coupling factor (superfamily II helicase)